MSSRHLPSAATKKILPALVFLAASGLSPLAAQILDGTAAQEVPAAQSTAPVTEEPLPAVAPPAALPAPLEPAPHDGADTRCTGSFGCPPCRRYRAEDNNTYADPGLARPAAAGLCRRAVIRK